jgi:F-type H+-transporting ATPase subunit b
VLINWFTVFAQIINFLILIWLLKRFLYGPIIKAMEERERKIASAMEQARKSEEQAKLHSVELARDKQALTDAREGLMAKAKEEVREWRERAMDDVRHELEKSRHTWMDGLNRDKQVFLVKLKRHVASQVVLIGEKVLRDLASEGLERQIIAVFLKNLSLEEEGSKFKSVSTDVHVQSGFELNDELSDELRRQLAKRFPHARSFQFEVATDLGIGIQVKTNHLKVGWNLTKYLEDLEKEILVELFKNGREAA